MIKNGELQLVETLDNKNMGDADTLADFIKWGQENYGADRNMLVMWDHGGGAAKGVCYDENYSFNALTLTEFRNALGSAGLTDKFDIIGFDDCLMASIEMAAVIEDHADYMVASQEIVPSGGWNDTEVAEALASDDDSLTVSRTICDSFMEKCRAADKDLYSTLSVYDLSKTDEMMKRFSEGAEYMNAISQKANYFSTISAAAKQCEKFGGDNPQQGSANMADLQSFFANAWEDNVTDNLTETMEQFVPYIVNSGARYNRGVSFYYPLVYNEREIVEYLALGINEEYNSFLTEHFKNVPDTTIEFNDMGSVNADGEFEITLSEQSYQYVSSIDFVLMNIDEDGTQHILCTDNDISKKDRSLKSNFRGISMAFDGKRMCSNTISSNDEALVFRTPIILNGERTYLRFSFIWDKTAFNGGYYELNGAWKGYDENGVPDNNIYELKSGDKIQLLSEMTIRDGRLEEIFGE